MDDNLRKINLNSVNKENTQTIPDKQNQPNNNKIETPMPSSSQSNLVVKLALYLIVAGLGAATGYFIHNLTSPGGTISQGQIKSSVPETGLKVGDIIGAADEKTFKDKATGVLEQGGIDGEGSHKLLRPGGISQTVYLTSSVVDLDEFTGTKVTVWGETFAAQKAGWLMDVGRVKVEELNATPPTLP